MAVATIAPKTHSPTPQQTEAAPKPKRPEPAETKAEQPPKETPPPKPVVNAQGQTTGKVVNTTA